jgi:hypothetical protein
MRAESSPLNADALLVQASSRSWSGGTDRCMRLLDGKPLLLRTLERGRRLFPQASIRILAPEFDRGGLDHIASSVDDCQIDYGFDDKPLKRMTSSTRDLGDDAVVLRVDGLHCFFHEDVIQALFDAVDQQELDIAKSPDDFPPPLTGEVWRVGALRRVDELLSAWPAEQAADFANRVGAIVASRPGANHFWTVEELDALTR